MKVLQNIKKTQKKEKVKKKKQEVVFIVYHAFHNKKKRLLDCFEDTRKQNVVNGTLKVVCCVFLFLCEFPLLFCGFIAAASLARVADFPFRESGSTAF